MSQKVVSSQQFFLDREDALQKLESIFERVSDYSENKFVFVIGEAGIGKTSLINKFLTSVGDKDTAILTARGYEEQDLPLFPFIDLIKDFIHTYRTFTRGDLFDTILNLAKLVPSLEPYVTTTQEITKTVRGISDVDKYSIDNSHYVFSNYLSIFQKIIKKKTLVLHAEDIQWFDSTSLELLFYIMKKIDKKIMIIVSYRTGFITTQKDLDAKEKFDSLISLDKDNSMLLELDSMPENLYPKFIEGFLGPHKIDSKTIHNIYKQTDGNPFFLKSLLRFLKESKVIFFDTDSYWKLDALLDLPSTGGLADTITKRLRKVYMDLPGSREVLTYASVLGYRFDLDILTSFMKKDKLEVFHLLQDLDQIYSIVKRIGDSTMFVFDHRKTLETIYSGLGSIAIDCHRDIAEFLESKFGEQKDPFIISYHYYRAREWEKALKFLSISAKTSFENYFFADSIKQYQECFKLIKDNKVSFPQLEYNSLRLGYAKALLGNNSTSECITNLNDLEKTASLTEMERAETKLLLGRCWRYEGSGDAGRKAIESLEESLKIYEKLGNVSKLGEVYSFLATVYDHFGCSEKSVKAFEKSQINFNLANDVRELAKLQRKSGIIYESRRAIEFMKNALDTFEKYSMKIEKARCLNNMGAESFYIGKFDDAQKYLGSSLEIFRSLDSPEVDVPLNNLGLVHQQRGEYSRALQFFEDANANVSELFDNIFINMNIANTLKQTGDINKAKQIMIHLEPLVLQYPESVMNDYYCFNRAVIHYELKEYDIAESWLQRFEPNNYKNDKELALAKRYHILSKIFDRKGIGSSEVNQKSLEIYKTARPQKWFYELDYYPCDIHIWD